MAKDVNLNRLRSAVLNGKSFSRAGLDDTPMLSPKWGGQWGFATHVGTLDEDGVHRAEWISSQAYVPRDIIPLLIQYPKFMDFMDEPELWKNSWKAMVEVHAETIEGLNGEITVETEENILGGSGSIVMDEPTATKIARSNVTYAWTEKMGRPFQRLLEGYIKYGILDPFTQVALIGQISKEAREMFRHGLFTADFYSSAILYIEPDVTLSHVVKAFLHMGAFPKSAGENTAKSDRANAKAISKLSVELAGFTVSNDSIMQFAQQQLEELTVRDTQPMTELPFDDRDADISDDTSDYGFNRHG